MSETSEARTILPSALAQVVAAAHFAARAHSGQRRKGAAQEPYVNHVLEVTDLLAQATGGNDPILLMGGLLHDTVEDCGVTNEEIAEKFGAEVAALVAEVTDDKSLPKPERKRLQIVHAPHKSDRAKMLKLADKTSNLRAIVSSPPDWPIERKREYFAWAGQVADGLRGVNATLEAGFDAAYEEGVKAFGAGAA